ncbi:hypothetical protein [Collinsella sp. HCP3S3_D1]|uniref:hypothetical protein n=1 Tax=Collinsella sp. HCP3S3_D1 TaxID=3438934 RepID=UPI003F887F41
MIQQVAFEVPADIAVGLATGKYVQWGGVVRDGAGHIVRHLKPADVQNGANKALRIADQAVQLAKQNKKVAIAALAVAGVAAVGGGIYAGMTHVRHSKEDAMRKKQMADFNSTFSEYLKALGDGELTIEMIDRLEGAITALNGGKEGFSVEIKGEQFEDIVKSVRDYTERLSKANGEKTSNAVLKLFEKKPNDIEGLKECLNTQRGILLRAA